jgi:uroporphyrinogen decarboxylase
MNSRERMCKALNRERPDRIPTFEYAIDGKIVEALCPGGTYADVVESLDLDGITAFEPSSGGYVAGMADRYKPGETFVDEWGVKRMATGEMSGYPLEEGVPIRDEADLRKITPPDPKDPKRYDQLRQYVKRFGGEKLISYSIRDTFGTSEVLMGLNEYLIAYKERPEFIRKLHEMTTDWVIAVAKEAVDAGADMIIVNSDLAYKDATFVHPVLMEELLGPCIKRTVEAVKKRRAYIFKHTHGNVWRILEMLVNSGLDALHPFATEDGMDISTVKSLFGRRIAVAGNISTDMLTRASREEVVRLTRETMARTSTDGGYILTASSSIYSGVIPENYRAMVETVHRYGRYR